MRSLSDKIAFIISLEDFSKASSILTALVSSSIVVLLRIDFKPSKLVTNVLIAFSSSQAGTVTTLVVPSSFSTVMPYSASYAAFAFVRAVVITFFKSSTVNDFLVFAVSTASVAIWIASE